MGKHRSAGGKKPAPPFEIDQFLRVRRTFGGRLSPDGQKVLFVTNLDGRYNLWTVPVDGGWPRQVTFQEEMIMGAAWVLRGTHIVFTADYQGNENRQLYRVPAEGGPVEDLSRRPEVQTFLGDVSRNTRLIAFSDNRREADRFDCYVLDLSTGKETKILQRDMNGIDVPSAFSEDGRYLLVYRDYHNLNSDILLVDRRTGRSKNLTAHEGDARFISPIFSGDGRFAFVVSDLDREFRNVMRIDLKSGESKWTFEARYDIANLAPSPDGRWLAMIEDRKANLTPRVVNSRTQNPLKIRWPAGLTTDLDFGRDGRTLLYANQGPTRPADLWVADLKKGTHRQITHSLVGGIREKDLVSPKYVSYRSFDGLRISGLLYRPKGAPDDGSCPAILWPHGGPNYHNENRFSPWFQTFVSRGLAVFAPDFRGSTGYGKNFQRRIFRDWGGGDLQDLLAGVNFMKEKGIADPKRIGVVGMSYGGFAVLTCITRAPEVFRAAVCAYGPANLFTFIDSNPPSWREGIYALVGHPERDRAYLEDRSPINRVHKIQTPLLVIQGKNDPRVAKAESDQIVDALRERGNPVEYIVYEDEGHGFSRKANEFDALKRSVDFLDRYLK
ncbi:MAG: alpha/beta hydrolase family protein [Planctomycetota bacterium]|jgi:dipeptidyl aminopeptidase/acylaminoacyl peptidase